MIDKNPLPSTLSYHTSMSPIPTSFTFLKSIEERENENHLSVMSEKHEKCIVENTDTCENSICQNDDSDMSKNPEFNTTVNTDRWKNDSSVSHLSGKAEESEDKINEDADKNTSTEQNSSSNVSKRRDE